jgi:hypothetical protein
MAEPIQHSGEGGKVSIWNLLSGVVWPRFFLYLHDYICILYFYDKQLSHEHLVCRFCGHTIALLGAWTCECGYSRPGTTTAAAPNVPGIRSA